MMTWQAPALIIVTTAASGYCMYRFLQLWKLMKAHRGKAPLVADFPARILTFFLNVLGQKTVLQKRWIGVAHFVIFWGFVVISFGTVEQFVSTIHSPYSLQSAGADCFGAFVLVQDLFAVAILLAVAIAAYRRYFARPEYLGTSRDAGIILALIAALMVSILLMNGFNRGGAAGLGLVFKWVHMLIVLGFAAYIPGSKHLHLVAAGPNTFLRTLQRQKTMAGIDFEDAAVSQYGAAKITDLSWKDALDYYSCTECGRCQEVCPASLSDKPLSPKVLIRDLKDSLFREKNRILAHEHAGLPGLVGKEITEDIIWSCTTCRACETACPVFIEHTAKIYEIRRNLVMMESRFPPEVQAVFKNLETNGSPWAFSPEDRMKWAEGLSVKTAAGESGAEYLLWVGCAGAYDDRYIKVMRSLVRLLKKAGIRFCVLGIEERCTGDAARRIGNEYLFQTLARANIETLNRYGIKKIITACPHCYNTLKNEYPAFGGNYEVIHHARLICQLIQEEKIRPAKGYNETITYHDSCYLGRWNGIYDAPREILAAIPSARIAEMKSHSEKGMCCGAGGGRMWMEEKAGKRINEMRVNQALETKAGIIAAACPFCMTMLGDGIKARNMDGKVNVFDIAEIVDELTT
ncbi:MAG: hypothetical protein A2583_14885 [Bdellovibrionales bacterium RIFOXYD1_FULL_53_11]|nr:MAG: hypothetical protein A2583_14885 [Bdellovibrionales bacterium RIFOXYD1_FULL_53_11]